MSEKKRKIKLLATHTHAGRDYPKDAELELSDSRCEWLGNMKKAAYVSVKTKE